MALSAAFQRALDLSLEDLQARTDVIGVLFFGSAARGEAQVGSDLDLYAITRQDRRGNLGRTVGTVPVEVSFGSIAQWRAHLEQERPAVVHAFATGQRLVDQSAGALEALCQEARTLWARGPSPIPAAAVLRYRFHLTDVVLDLAAMPEQSGATALLASAGMRQACEALCAIDRAWLPSMRHLLATLDATHPALATLGRQCAEAGFPATPTIQFVDAVLARLGGRLDAYDTTGPE